MKLHGFACRKHGRIATHVVITIPWTPDFIKEMRVCEGRDKVWFLKSELDGMDGISVWIAVGVLVPVW
jgi:hypothetical protein